MPRWFVRTTIPADSIFRFEAIARAEGGKEGIRVTIPARIVRGLVHLGWDRGEIKVLLSVGVPDWWKCRARAVGASICIALPKGARGGIARGGEVAVALRLPDRAG